MIVIVENSFYFIYIIKALQDCFNQLNIKHIIIEDYYNNYNYNDTDIYLLLTTHEPERIMPKRYISYNFEQFTADVNWCPFIFERLRNAEIVFDYSLENIKELKKHNINAHFLPLGYAKSMEFPKPDNLNKYIDFTFVGKIYNTRRYDKIIPLLNIYFNSKDNTKRLAFYHNDCWKEKLENIYVHSKIGLNIHLYSGKTIFEILRIILLIANKVLVITEPSDDKWYNEKYKNMVYFFKNINYSIDCVNVLQNYSIDKAEQNYQELINNHKYVDYVKNISHLLINL